jgi:hypothetical protein
MERLGTLPPFKARDSNLLPQDIMYGV